MTLALTQTVSAVGPNIQASFLGVGGAEPYTYSVLPGGAGGTINADTGVYVSPAAVNPNPAMAADTIQVVDGSAATATSQIVVGTPILLFCDVIQHELGLANGRVYLWDQKIFQPKDYDLYVAVSMPSCRPFANVNRQAANGIDSEQFVSMQALVDVDIISRGPAARDRKEEVIMALNSTYAQQQQEVNGFYIGKLSPTGGFINLSEVDGAAIPYRYRISVQMQYAATKTTAVSYFDNFSIPEITTNA